MPQVPLEVYEAPHYSKLLFAFKAIILFICRDHCWVHKLKHRTNGKATDLLPISLISPITDLIPRERIGFSSDHGSHNFWIIC